MNILQLVPKLNVGGVEKGTIEVARYLTLNGHKAVVVSAGGRMEKDLSAIGGRHYTLPVGSKNPLVMIRCYFKLRHIIRKDSIDIVHGRSRVPALIGYFAARSLQKTFVTTAHGQYRKHLISKVMGWGKVVITANETMARYMKDNFNVPRQKITIIPRGVDLKKFSFVPPSAARSKPFRVGMICRFTPLKGHVDFLKAMAHVLRKIPDVEIVMMGDRTSAKEEYLRRISLTMRRLMIERSVKFVDSTKDVADVIGGLDVLVSANSEQEAFGRSIIEAQARGVPVVATRIGGVVENINDGLTGLFCAPKDPTDMAAKIMRYAEEPDLVMKVAENARKYVEENYSLEKTMTMTLEAYKRVFGLKNILIFKISSLGDIILSTPSLRAVRNRFKNANIKILVDVRFRELLDNCPYIDEIIAGDFKNRDNGIGFLKLAGKLRAEDFDVSIDLQNNRKSHLLSFLSAIPERFGYDNGKLSFLLNRKISVPRRPMTPVKHQSFVLGLLGITGIKQNLELWPGDANEAWAERFLKERWMIEGQKLVALSLSASRRWETKNWGVPAMVELARILARDKGMRVVLLGAEEDRPCAAEFLKKTEAKPIDAVGKTNVPQLISLIERCNALVTGDSAPMHVAAATGTPFVALFGPTDPDRHIPPSEDMRVLYKNLKCSPCYKPTCKDRSKCITSIKPEKVVDALMEVMKQS